MIKTLFNGYFVHTVYSEVLEKYRTVAWAKGFPTWFSEPYETQDRIDLGKRHLEVCNKIIHGEILCLL